MNILIGFFMPALIGTVNKHVTGSDARFWISVLLCAIVAMVVNLVEHNGFPGYMGLSWLAIADSFGQSFLAIFGMTKISYEALWNNESVGKLMPNDGEKSPLQMMDLK